MDQSPYNDKNKRLEKPEDWNGWNLVHANQIMEFQQKRIAELEADKAELVDALETVWGAVTYWEGDDWTMDQWLGIEEPPATSKGGRIDDRPNRQAL
jgi:hypothetical protein